LDLDLRRQQWRLHCGVRRAFIRRRQRRMRLFERRQPYQRADQSLQRRQGVCGERQRAVDLDLRRLGGRYDRLLLGDQDRLHWL
jgi:hypothetical protein